MSRPEEIADGVFRLGTDWVNWYLCLEADRVVVVDCGFRGYFEQLPAALAALGRSLDEVAAVVLTHYHPDHVGSAETIRTKTGAEVYAPAGDIDGVRSGRAPIPGGMAANAWRPVVMRYLAHVVRSGGIRPLPVPDAVPYEADGDQDLPLGLRAIFTPGHTRGHCALLYPEQGVLFAGDAIANIDFFGRAVAPRLLPFNEDAELAGRSLGKLEGASAGVLAPGHGPPRRGNPGEAVEVARSAWSKARPTSR